MGTIAARNADIFGPVQFDDSMQAEAEICLRQNNVVFLKIGELYRSNFDNFSVTNCGGHTPAARLKKHAQPLLQERAHHAFEKFRITAVVKNQN